MRLAFLGSVTAVLAVVGFAPSAGGAETMVDSDFAKGGFADQGWKVDGAWDVFQYPTNVNNPGPVARFQVHKPGGTLTRTFAEVRDPRELTLALDYGWGWGDPGQASDALSFMLLDNEGAGYVFKFHRTKATWAVQWGKAVGGQAKDMKWAPKDIDGSHPSVRDGGGLLHVVIRRQSDASWSIASKDWNKGAGATVRFLDATTNRFSRLVLVGSKNFDEQLFNKIVLTTSSREPVATAAVPTSTFLNSIGICTTMPDRGQPLAKTVEMIRYAGFRWVRGGVEGLKPEGPTTVQTYLDLCRQTGVRVSWGLGSGGAHLDRLIETAKPLAEAGVLLAFEGNNEPNNWGVTYQGEKGGGKAASWMAVAKLHRDMCKAVKSDPVLKKYPVWSLSAAGAQRDNVGVQFLTIPAGAGTVMPEGTQYADFVNVHNYIYHPNSPAVEDNKTWHAADPLSTCRIDGLYGNHGLTWAGHFRGYPESELPALPRVTTETGTTIGGPVNEDVQALNLMNVYLSQFKRGWAYTSVYLLRDRTDEAGNQTFGYFKPDYTPRKAAVYLHNLTTILADKGAPAQPGQLSYSLPEQPSTVHELLLEKSDGTFQLVVWGERVHGTDDVTIRFAKLAGATIYDPTVGTEPVRTAAAADALKLTVGDHPLVLAIGPQ